MHVWSVSFEKKVIFQKPWVFVASIFRGVTTRGETQRFPASKTNISSKCSYVKSESLRAVETLEFEPDLAAEQKELGYCLTICD